MRAFWHSLNLCPVLKIFLLIQSAIMPKETIRLSFAAMAVLTTQLQWDSALCAENICLGYKLESFPQYRCHQCNVCQTLRSTAMTTKLSMFFCEIILFLRCLESPSFSRFYKNDRRKLGKFRGTWKAVQRTMCLGYINHRANVFLRVCFALMFCVDRVYNTKITV